MLILRESFFIEWRFRHDIHHVISFPRVLKLMLILTYNPQIDIYLALQVDNVIFKEISFSPDREFGINMFDTNHLTI